MIEDSTAVEVEGLGLIATGRHVPVNELHDREPELASSHAGTVDLAAALPGSRCSDHCQIADHEQYTVPSTIEDPAVLEALRAQLGG